MITSNMEKLSEMVHKINRIINNHKWTVDQQTIDHFNEKFAQGGYSKLINCQAELLEYSLERCGLLEATDTYRNDGVFSFWPEMKPDFKRKPAKRDNVSISKWQDKVISYNTGKLTHFIGFSQNIETLLEVGQQHTFKMEAFIHFTQADQHKIPMEGFYLLPVVKK